jgi:hypothetical protein
MDTWIIWVVGCSIAYWIGLFVGRHRATYNMMLALARDPESFLKMAQALKTIEDSETQEELDHATGKSTGTEMTVERQGNQLFAYTKDTNQFLGQAADLNTLLKTVNERFPGKDFFGTISADDPAKELVK